MPFYIRKSVSAGPFRFNLSKGGIGLSVGVRGLRIGTGPRGHYVHAGRAGLYYRKTLTGASGASGRRTGPQVVPDAEGTPLRSNGGGVEMVAVSSGTVAAMEDERFAEILAEMNLKQASLRMASLFMWIGVAFAILATIGGGIAGFVTGTVITLVARALGSWLDQSRRSVVLFYDLEDEVAKAYELLTTAFDRIAACHGKWHIDAGGAVVDTTTWKRNAGASHLLDKRPTSLAYGLPAILKCNLTPPSITVGKETLYLLPDFMLVVHAGTVGAVAYDQLDIRWQDSSFIEEGVVPPDTTVLFHTWKHPNKSGGPDRRFANNFQIPVCLYESIHLTSSNGLNELLQVSCKGVAAPFAAAVGQLSAQNGSREAERSLPMLTAG